MKMIILSLLVLILSNCATETYRPDDLKASACYDKNENTTLCDNVRLYMDPYRFHKLGDYQKKHLPDIPDLP